MNKKAITQIDWIMSLAIFMLFIGWFFIYIQPFFQFTPENNAPDKIAEEFLENYQTSVRQTPLFVYSNQSYNKTPLIFDLEAKDSYINNTGFVVHDKGKLFTVAPVKKGNNILMLNQGVNHTNPTKVNFHVRKTFLTTTDLRVDFKDSVIKEISFTEDKKISDFEYQINGEKFNPETHSYTKKSGLAKYNFSENKNTHTTHIFHQFSLIYNYVNLKNPGKFEFKLNINDYDSFFVNNAGYGKIQSGCNSYSGKSIKLKNEEDSMAITFSAVADIKLCSYNKTSAVFELDSIKNANYVIDFSNQNNIRAHNTKTSAGLSRKIEALDIKNIGNHSQIKQKLRINEDFSISFNLMNGTNYKYQSASPGDLDNVYVTERSCHWLDKKGYRQGCRIGVKTW